jgi:Family of unknown function (DUF6152)
MRLPLSKPLFLALGLAAAWPAVSHHSTAMYDNDNMITLGGTIKVMQWRNPHVTITFVNDPTAGQPARTWTVEVSSPGVMTRSGWTKRSLNPGDRVQVLLSPLRDGMPGGQTRQITLLATGEVLRYSNRDGEQAGLE